MRRREFTLAALSVCGFAPRLHAATAPLTADQWREDIRFFGSELPRRHKNLFFRLTRPQFDGDVAALASEADRLSDPHIRMRLRQIAAKVGDLHTGVAANMGPQLPLLFSSFQDDLWVVAVGSEEGRRLMGAKVVSVGGVPSAEACSRVATLVSGDNRMALKATVPWFLSKGDALEFLGLSRTRTSASLQLEINGKAETVEVSSGDSPPQWIWPWTTEPLYFRNRGRNYWFEYVPESHTLYLSYNNCEEQKDLPFGSFANQVTEAVRAHPPDRIVIDLRRNGGGNERVINPIYGVLERAAKPVFVIVGRGTMSSAYDNAQTLKDRHRVTLVGEPTGQKPNSYGEVRSFELPHSKLGIRYSTKFWHKVPGDPDSMYPDIPAEPTAAAYFAGRDVAMEAILISRPGAQQHLAR